MPVFRKQQNIFISLFFNAFYDRQVSEIIDKSMQ